MMKLLQRVKNKKKAPEIESFLTNDFETMNILDKIAPAILDEKENYIKLGQNYVRCFAVTDYPTNVEGNWLSELYRFKGNVTLSYHIKPISSQAVEQKFSKSVEELEVRLEDKKISPIRFRKTKEEYESANRLLDHLIMGNGNTMFHVHLYVLFQAKSLEELEDLTKEIEKHLYSVRLTAKIPEQNMICAFQSGLPLLQNDLPEFTWRNIDSHALSSYFPFDEAEIFEQTGIVKGINEDTGAVVLCDLWSKKSHNEVIIGFTGTGKTFSMSCDMLRYYMHGCRIYIIDPEREFKRLVESVGGQYITLSPTTNTIINPLEIMHTEINNADEEEDKENQSFLYKKLQRLKTFFRLIKPDMTNLEAALVEQALIKVYDEFGITWDSTFESRPSDRFPTLENLYQMIEEMEDDRLEDFKAILHVYVYGSTSKMFNGHTNVNLNNDMICFDLKELEDDSEVQPAAMYNVLSFLWDDITKTKSLPYKRLYVDEAHVLADPDNPKAMKFLFNVYKRIRKYKGGATVATQSPADFLSATDGKRNYGGAMIGQANSLLILPLKDFDLADLDKYHILSLSDKEKTILRKENQGEGIYVVGKKRVHIKITSTKEEMRLIDPEKYKKTYREDPRISPYATEESMSDD
ncbi:DUF87 domain-containing protein [Fictibacillus sp. Mic-4]|uniref:VirB4 family type IV secretion system protein n=1 Tax=Fictibacillus TaxID=1329200 RepID=UPI000413DBD2|nr:DUF87 domain-containing protein [Fictibacillus gelatini]HAJ3957186.1 hypothetical protein [Escherichia coli]